MMRFLDFLFPPRSDERAMRDFSDDDFAALALPYIVPETRPETVALLPFNNPIVRSTLHEAKYHGNERAFRLLGSTLADFLPDYVADFEFYGHRKSIIVPVPLGKVRRKERGFNQAEEIAKYALKNLGSDFSIDVNLLERIKETQTQVSLERKKREENMRGAFTASPRLRSASRIELTNTLFIVLDDVVTTGATLQAASSALRDAGALHILPIALAH